MMSISIRPTKEVEGDRPTIGAGLDENPISIDIDLLIGTRMLIQANSGGGKTWALRRLLEQTHGRVQHIVLDPEGEFHTLRTDFDYVLAAPREGDCVATPETAELLARRLLQLEASAIIDIFDLPLPERRGFVRLFLESLIEAPRDLWHPALIVLDEAQVFAPQNGRAESTQAVIDLMTRGRKRGQSGMLVTQRISALHKDAAAECNNKMIGRSVLDVDTKRAADELGFRSRAQQQSLRGLKPGEFYAFGPALCAQVTRIKVGRVVTQHKEPGSVSPPMTPPPESVKAALAKLADLPVVAEQEADDRENLRRRVRELESQLEDRDPAASDTTEKLRRAEAESERLRADCKRLRGQVTQYGREVSLAIDEIEASTRTMRDAALALVDGSGDRDAAQGERGGAAERGGTDREESEPGPGGDRGGFPPGMTRILRVLCDRFPSGVESARVAVLAQMTPKSGTFQAYLAALERSGFIVRSGGLIACTKTGFEVAKDFAEAPNQEELIAFWCRSVGSGGAGRLLDQLCGVYPAAITRADLATACGISASGGTFGSYLSRLRSRGLVAERGNDIRAASVLFDPEGGMG